MKQKKNTTKALKPEMYCQQVHVNCGGWLVVVAKRNAVAAACNKCGSVWEVASPLVGFGVTVPKDWEKAALADTILRSGPAK
jgi:hypothetical protein